MISSMASRTAASNTYRCSPLDDRRRTSAEGEIEFWERKTGFQKSGLQLGVFKVPQSSKSILDLPNPVKYQGFTETTCTKGGAKETEAGAGDRDAVREGVIA